MKLQEEYDLSIYVDGMNIDDAPGVIFLGGEVREGICDPVPTCLLKLSIPIGWLDKRSIVDGTLIKFEIKNTKQNMYENLEFRLFNINKIEINK